MSRGPTTTASYCRTERAEKKYEIVKRINRELQVLYRGLVDPLPGESMAPGDIRSEAVFHVGAETDETVKPFAV